MASSDLPRNTYFRYIEDVAASAVDIEYLERVMTVPLDEAVKLTGDECFEEREDHGVEP